MPPRTRASKPAKGLKENIEIVGKAKVISAGKVTKPPRKALADKTNSASDDNASFEIPKKVTKKPTESGKERNLGKDIENNDRPRRDRRLPNRYVENNMLKNLTNSEETFTPESTIYKTHTPSKSVVSVNSSTASSFKTPQKPAETSLVVNRPRRICRLPSKFEDHSISPNKFIPVQPIHASTPKLSKTVSKLNYTAIKGHSKGLKNVSNVEKFSKRSDSILNKSTNTLLSAKPKTITKKDVPVKKTGSKAITTSKPANQGRTLRGRKHGAINSPPKTIDITLNTKKSLEVSRKKSSPKKASHIKRPIQQNFSYRVLEGKKSSKEEQNPDIYEFTYDPNEEPPPQKKKKRKVVKKKPSKPKTVIFKNNYEQNLSKILTTLKSAVAKKPVGTQKQINNEQNLTSLVVNDQNTLQKSTNMNNQVVANMVIGKPTTSTTIEAPKVSENKSVQIEDIAAKFEVSLDHQDINYSPVNSPHPNCPETPTVQLHPPPPEISAPNSNDPLNLRDNLSFFDDQPVASSSMNTSVRHPQASPWRIEFGSLPIKWHVNSYVKPNMTPAVECSFVNFEDSNKKHVYTNMVPQSNESLPEIVEKSPPNLVQSSIISFIKEVVEKNANKKQRARSKTPTACIFSEVSNSYKAIDNMNKQTRQVTTPKKNTATNAINTVISKNVLNSSSDKENSKTLSNENSRENLKRKNGGEINQVPAKTPRKDEDNYFGFDESEVDQENVSPSKDARKVRGLRPRARLVLKEINEQGPTRAQLPLAAKSKDLETVNRLYGEIKSATDAPVFPEKDVMQTEPVVEATNINFLEDEDSQSVHLFEDIELVHHLKPHRKSYSKAKKVAFRTTSSDSDSQSNNIAQAEVSSGEEDDLHDLTFGVPVVVEKKPRKKQSKKQKMTKKELQEADEWAANFNSMCEDVEDFVLVVE